jgi:hypothetical protein
MVVMAIDSQKWLSWEVNQFLYLGVKNTALCKKHFNQSVDQIRFFFAILS